MKAFEYLAPESLDEAIALLDARGARARPLAGGTDLVPQLRAKKFDLDVVLDIKRIPEVRAVSYAQGGLIVGAAVPCCRLYEDPAIAAGYPALIDAVAAIGGIAVQSRATLGGNLCNSSPSGDAITAMVALGVSGKIVGPGGTRVVPVEQFCTGPGRNVLERGELLVSLHFPARPLNSGARYRRFTPRNEMDIAVVGVAASVVLSDDWSRFKAVRIALGAVAPTPLLVERVGVALAGNPVCEDAVNEAATLAKEAAKPIDDMRGSAAFRRHLVAVLTKRALGGAIDRAKGGRPDGE